MRASLGFRAGPLYIGTGNLLKSKPKQRRYGGTEVTVWLIVAPFVLLYFTAVILWWLLVQAWGSCVRLATRRPVRDAPPTTTTAPSEPADDPAWTPRH